jgi:hypothetical protein
MSSKFGAYHGGGRHDPAHATTIRFLHHRPAGVSEVFSVGRYVDVLEDSGTTSG